MTEREAKGGEAISGRRGASLRIKTVLILMAVVLLPLGITIAMLLDVNRRAVETSERNLQASVIAEATQSALRLVRATQSDAQALAAAISYAVATPGAEGDVIGGVRALLATRGSLAAVRFEVPDAKINTVIRRDDAGAADVPESTPELRKAADAHGVSLSMLGAGRGILVVPVPRREGSDGARGYVTAGIDFAPLAEELETLGTQRFEAGARLLLVDGRRRVVASYGVAGLKSGADASKLPVLRPIEGASFDTRLAMVGDHVDQGQKMIGAIETVPSLGWTVALWRLEADAYKVLAAMQSKGIMVSLGALALALLVGVVVSSVLTTPILDVVKQSRTIAARRWREVKLASDRGDELGELTRSLGQMAHDLEASEAEIARLAKLRGDLSRYLSKDLVEAIVEGRQEIGLGGERVRVTVFFSDIRSYTTLTEKSTPAQVVEMLNEYFGEMVGIVFENKGTLDKFIGDAIMAVYGAPMRLPDHALRACRAALQMRAALAAYNARREAAGKIPIHVGMGMATDEVVCGNIGSEERMEYTAIGDGVNLASRLEGATKVYGVDILLSELCHAEVEGAVVARELDLLRVKGKKLPVKVFELVAMPEDPLPEATRTALLKFREGYALYHQMRFSEARAAFEAALLARADDAPSKVYLDRCQYFQESPPPAGWDGVWELKDK